jgi:hypothetical protein
MNRPPNRLSLVLALLAAALLPRVVGAVELDPASANYLVPPCRAAITDNVPPYFPQGLKHGMRHGPAIKKATRGGLGGGGLTVPKGACLEMRAPQGKIKHAQRRRVRPLVRRIRDTVALRCHEVTENPV